MRTIKITQNKEGITLAIIFLISFLIFLSPTIIRQLNNNHTLLGQEGYFHARVSNELKTNIDTTIIDKGTIQETKYKISPYHILLNSISKLIDIETTSKIIPPLLGALTILLIAIMMKYYGLSQEIRFIAITLITITPATIHNFSTSTLDSINVFLIVLAGYLILRQQPILKTIGVVILTYMATTTILNCMIIIGILIIYWLIDLKNHKNAIWLTVLVTVAAIMVTPQNIQNNGEITNNTIAEMGAIQGISIFTLGIALIGLIALWRNKKQNNFAFLSIIALTIMTIIYGKFTNIYLTIILAIFASHGLMLIIQRHWEINGLRLLSTTLIIIAIIISTTSYIERLSNIEPTNKQVDAAKQLKELNPGVVVSQAKNGYIIQYFSDKKTIEDNEHKNKIGSELFAATSLETAKSIMINNSIKYIYIDQRMKNGEVWQKPDEGLLFLFRNNETFKKIYANKEVEIWELIQ